MDAPFSGPPSPEDHTGATDAPATLGDCRGRNDGLRMTRSGSARGNEELRPCLPFFAGSHRRSARTPPDFPLTAAPRMTILPRSNRSIGDMAATFVIVLGERTATMA